MANIPQAIDPSDKMPRRNIAGWGIAISWPILAWVVSCPATGQEFKPARIVTTKVVIPDCARERLQPTQVARQGASFDMENIQERDDLAPEPMSRRLRLVVCGGANPAPGKPL